MGTIEGIYSVWNHTDDVSVGAYYVPIVLNTGEDDEHVPRFTRTW